MLNKIKFSYEELASHSGLFTPSHRKYSCTIKYNGKQYTFDYQCNLTYSNPNLIECVESILLDGFAYDGTKDIIDFAKDFGYDIYDETTKRTTESIYNACRNTSKALHRIFTDEELSILQDEINDYYN